MPTKSEAAKSELLKFAVLFYGASFLPKLRKLPREQVDKISKETVELSFQQPLHLCHADEFIVPTWNAEEKLTGGKVIALMVFCLWILCNEDEKIAGPLVEKWPIKEAVAIAARQEV